jgi:hypothetical protein
MKGITAALGALVLAGLAFLFFTAGGTSLPEMTDTQIAGIQAAVRQAADAQHNTWIAQEDLDAHVSDHSAWAGAPWSGSSTLGDMRSRQEEHWARWDYEPVDPPQWEVRVLGPEVAAVRGTVERITRTDTTGVVQNFTASFAHVWVVEDGRWKILLARENWVPIEN